MGMMVLPCFDQAFPVVWLRALQNCAFLTSVAGGIGRGEMCRGSVKFVGSGISAEELLAAAMK